MKVSPLEGVYTIRETAELTKLSEWSIRREIEAGRLRAKQVGRCKRIIQTDLEQWMKTDFNTQTLALTTVRQRK
jgi:excisionase family DNA binding protein